MCSFRVGTSKGEKNPSHAHKTGCWYLLGAYFKIPEEQPQSFIYGSPPGHNIGTNEAFFTFQSEKIWL